jgi:hypothetical protein
MNDARNTSPHVAGGMVEDDYLQFAFRRLNNPSHYLICFPNGLNIFVSEMRLLNSFGFTHHQSLGKVDLARLVQYKQPRNWTVIESQEELMKTKQNRQMVRKPV